VTASSSLVTASSTITGQFNATGGAQFGTLNASGIFTSTATGANTLPYASSTSLTVSNTGYFGTASTTNLNATFASTSILTAGLASTTSLNISSIASGSLLKTTTAGSVVAAVAGSDYVTGAGLSAAFPFTPGTFGVTIANATGTLIKFTAGIAATASSTIGDGTQVGGLTIFGGATTTGSQTIQGTLRVGTSTGIANSTATFGDGTGSKFIQIDGGAGAGAADGGSIAFSNGGATSAAVGGVSTVVGGAFSSDLALWAKSGNNVRIYPNNTEVGRFSGTGFAVTGSTTISSAFNSISSNLLGSTTLLGSSLFANATSSTFAITGITSGNLLKTTTNGSIIAAVAGVDYATPAGAFDFTPATFGATKTNATTTALQLTGGLYASSTIQFGNAGVAGQFTFNSTTGNLGLGTSSPFATFALENNASTTNPVLFNISSTTNSGGIFSTSTLFRISNTGLVTASSSLITASSTVTGQFNAVGGAQFGTAGFSGIITSTATGANTLPFASSTSLTVSNTGYFGTASTTNLNATFASSTALTVFGTGYFGTASSTNLTISSIATGNLLKTTTAGSVVAAVAGSDYVTGAGLSAAFPFTPGTNFGVTSNSTSTLISFNAGLAASSTAQLSNTNIYGLLGFASTSSGTSTLATYQGHVFITASTTDGLVGGNTSLGIDALTSVTSGAFNTAFGYQTLAFGTSTKYNTAIGYGALPLTNVRFSATANNNTAVGYQALNLNRGNRNTALGTQAGYLVVTGDDNIDIGYGNGGNGASSRNVIIGNYISGNDSTLDSVLLGHQANFSAYGTTKNSVLVGEAAGYYLGSTGAGNVDTQTFIGYQAGMNVTSGWDNLLIGASTTPNLTTGFNNLIIGNHVFATSSSASNSLNIGGILFGTLPATSTAFQLPTSGSLGVGTSSPFAKFAIQTNNGDTATTLFAIGSSTQSATSTFFTVSNIGSTTLYQIPSSLLKTNANGTIVAAIPGTDYATAASVFAFPFTPTTNFGVNTNATGTIINFTAGIQASSTSQFTGINSISATTSLLSVTGSSTITGQLNAVGGAQFGTAGFSGIITSTATGASTFPYASSTSLTVSNTGYFGTASTTNLNAIFASTSVLTAGLASTTNLNISSIASGSLLKTTTAGSVVAAVAGTDYATVAGAFDFTPATFGATKTNATTTALQLTGGLFASSTVQFGNAAVAGQFTFNSTTGNLGLGTSSPFATFALENNASTTNPVLFNISSTTNSGGIFSTSTLFRISNTGLVTASSSLITASSTITGQFNAVGGAQFGTAGFSGIITSTAIAANVLPYASSTSLTVSNTGYFGTASTTNLNATFASTTAISATTASTTNFFGASLTTCTSGNVLTWSAGLFGCAVDATAAGAANPFTWTTNFGVLTAATSSILNATNGIQASSTSQFTGINTISATTSVLSVTGSSTITGILNVGGLANLNGGLLSYASSTIGGGTAITGLTINGGATTTGGAYFGGNVGIQTQSPSFALDVSGTIQSQGTAILRLNALGGTIWQVNGGAGTTLNIGEVGGNGTYMSFSGGNVAIGGSTQTGTKLSLTNTSSGAAAVAAAFNNADSATSTASQILFRALDVTTAATSTGAIAGVLTQNYGRGMGALAFSTLNSGVLTEAARISGTGSLGLGTTSPLGLFTLSANNGWGNGYASTTLFLISSSTQSATTTLFLVDNTGTTTLLTATTTSLYGAGLNVCQSGNVLTWAGGKFGCAVDATGTGSAFPFTPINATSVATSSGLVITASSTIGNGNQNGGLTVSGGATTTGNMSIGGRLEVGAASGFAQSSKLSVITGTQFDGFALKNAALANIASITGLNADNSNGLFKLWPDATTLTASIQIVGSGTSYFNGGNVGFGTTSPFGKLSIHANNGEIFTNNTLFAIGSSTQSATTTLFSIDNTGATTIGDPSGTGAGDAIFQYANDANAWSAGYFATDKSFRIASSTTLSSNIAFTIAKGGNIGLGTTSPFAWLTLEAGASTTQSTFFSISSTTNTAGVYATSSIFTIVSNGRVGIGTSSPYAQLTLFAGTTTATAGLPFFAVASSTRGTATATLFVIDSMGKVGIGTPTPWGKLSVSSANIVLSWSQVGSTLNVPSAVNPAALATLSPNRVAFVTATGGSLRTYEFNGSTWSQIGSSLAISTVGGQDAIAALSPNRIAFIDSTNQSLRVYEFNGSTWSQVGSGITLTASNGVALAALAPNRVAVADGLSDTLRTYEFNGGTWSQIGNDLSLGATGAPAMTTLSPNRVAFVDNSNTALRVYEFNGSNWSQVGNAFAGVGGGTLPALAALSPTRVAAADGTNQTLRTYDFNGNTWVQVGGTVALSTGAMNMTTLSPNRVAFYDSSNQNLTNYQFSTPLLNITNSQDYPYLSVSDTGLTTAEDLAIRSTLTIGQAATSTSASSTPALIVNGNSSFSGLVGLGTTSPWAQLTILANNSATSSLLFAIASSSATGLATSTNSLFVVNTLGNIGVSTTSPIGRLAIDTSGMTNVNTLSFIIGSTSKTDFIVTPAGRVGLATTSPSAKLAIEMGSSTPASFFVANQGSSSPAFFIANTNGNGAVGVGTSSPAGQFSIDTTGVTSGRPSFIIGSTSKTDFIVNQDGKIGIGTSTLWTTFAVKGSVVFNGLTATTSTTTSATNLCLDKVSFEVKTSSIFVGCIGSSQRFKHDIAPLTVDSLSLVNQLKTSSYIYNEDPTNTQTWGFIAEQADAVDHHLSVSQDGVITNIVDRSIMAITVGAIQQLDLNLETIASTTASSTPASRAFANNFFISIFAHITTWLASAGNGIADLFATTLHADTVYAKKLCLTDEGGETCITKSQLDSLLNGQGAAPASGGSTGGSSNSNTTSTSSDPAAPVITVSGNNPATIAIGATYNDLGATVTDDKDHNLSILASVDGGEKITLDAIHIDTATSSTHTIVYSATDSDGNVGQATRTVNVIDLSTIITPPPPAATSTPDTITPPASGTTSTSTPQSE
jgi:hypothetical protein